MMSNVKALRILFLKWQSELITLRKAQIANTHDITRRDVSLFVCAAGAGGWREREGAVGLGLGLTTAACINESYTYSTE